MTIDNVSLTEVIDPDWGNAVADALNDVYVQSGSIVVGASGGPTSSDSVTFPTPYDVEPVIVATIASSNGAYYVTTNSESASGFDVVVVREGGGAVSSRTVNWVAVGPRP